MSEIQTGKNIIDGVIIGGAGGAFAGIAVYGLQYVHNRIREFTHKRRVLKWLKENTLNSENKHRSTRAIASWNNLTEDRVRYICSIHKDIYLSTGQKPDIWGVNPRLDQNANTGDLL